MLGSAGEKITRIVDLAEELYDRMVELREQMTELREATRETRDRVAGLEDEVAQQRDLLEAVAEAQGVDVEAVASRDGEPEGAESDDSAAEPAEGR